MMIDQVVPVYEEGIVQDMKLIIEKTEFEPLGHLIRPSLPGKSLIIQRFLTNSCYVERSKMTPPDVSLCRWVPSAGKV